MTGTTLTTSASFLRTTMSILRFVSDATAPVQEVLTGFKVCPVGLMKKRQQ